MDRHALGLYDVHLLAHGVLRGCLGLGPGFHAERVYLKQLFYLCDKNATLPVYSDVSVFSGRHLGFPAPEQIHFQLL